MHDWFSCFLWSRHRHAQLIFSKRFLWYLVSKHSRRNFPLVNYLPGEDWYSARHSCCRQWLYVRDRLHTGTSVWQVMELPRLFGPQHSCRKHKMGFSSGCSPGVLHQVMKISLDVLDQASSSAYPRIDGSMESSKICKYSRWRTGRSWLEIERSGITL
jgi:hypothetical protein